MSPAVYGNFPHDQVHIWIFNLFNKQVRFINTLECHLGKHRHWVINNSSCSHNCPILHSVSSPNNTDPDILGYVTGWWSWCFFFFFVWKLPIYLYCCSYVFAVFLLCTSTVYFGKQSPYSWESHCSNWDIREWNLSVTTSWFQPGM